MKWSVVRTIWFREVRDQLRDRRTLFMLVVLPILLYPMLGMATVQFASVFQDSPMTIGIVNHEQLEKETPAGRHQLARLPPMADADGSRFNKSILRDQELQGGIRVRLDSKEALRELLEQGKLQAIIEFNSVVVHRLKEGGQVSIQGQVIGKHQPVPKSNGPATATGGELTVLLADGDHGVLAFERLRPIFRAWEVEIIKARIAAVGGAAAPEHYHDPISIDPLSIKSERIWSRMFPFLIVMMSLTGALYPAIDLCAGEKERGTMETLLISPASRAEIVCGKFLTVWLFSAATALLNLASLGFTAWNFSRAFSVGGESAIPMPGFAALGWCVAILVPLAAFFSALCLALAIYARSTREGQYYLMPLMLITLPLTLLSMAPGIELTPALSLVPITGPALLLQDLMNASSADQLPWGYLAPVLLPLAACGFLALYWAIQQFHREDVLFRGADRLDLGLMLRRALRTKRPMPTAGMAAVCFAIIMLLRWVATMNAGAGDPLAVIAVMQVACVAAPAVLMAVLLTSQPLDSLRLRAPLASDASPGTALAANPVAQVTRWRWAWFGVALVLALAVHAPLVYVVDIVLDQFPVVREAVRQFEEQIRKQFFEGTPRPFLILAFGFLPAVCEELAFRGFILTGLTRRMGAHWAVIASSLLFAFAHGNAFQFLPTLILGLILGVLATRSGSLWPGMLFHMLHNTLLVLISIELAPYQQQMRETGQTSVDLGPLEMIYSWQGLSVSFMALLVIVPALIFMPVRDRNEPTEGGNPTKPEGEPR